MSAPLITYQHSVPTTAGCTFEIVRLISGKLELSALYAFKFLVKAKAEHIHPDACVEAMQQLLGKRVRISIHAGSHLLQTVHGLVMSIESSTQYGKGEDAGWYIWTIRPELAQACYSCNRRVFAASTKSITDSAGKATTSTASLLEVLTEYYQVRWNTLITFSEAALKRLPDTIQLRQNDESDYNFLTRILASWGLGYSWDFSGERESVTVYDAVDDAMARRLSDIKDPSVRIPAMHPVSSSAAMWKLSFGVPDLLKRSKALIENYNDIAQTNEGYTSLHDESWDQRLSTSFTRDTVGIYRSRNDNGHSCHGAVNVQEEADAEDAARLCLGGKVRWATDTDQYRSSDIYYITSLQFSAANKSWEAIISGRVPDAQSGLGILPKPVHLNNSSDLSADELICGDAWPEPQSRYFLAVVEDGSGFGDDNADALPGRNLCKVREIAPQTISKSAGRTITLENTLWVELGSPFADNDSGLLARPRKGNVLLCLDRGDLSIPLAVSALFRDNNSAPVARLKTMERHLRTNLEPTTDYSTVTLRNRVHIPERTYNSTTADPCDSSTLATRTKNGKSETYSLSEQTTRPMSVTELADSPLPFSQIQLVSRDNGTKPIPHNNDITNTYLSSSIIETVAGTLSDTDSGGNYVMANAAKTAQSLQNAPITRPHFEGVNIYSSCDVLLQSADHQIINAGGEIVVTADKGITLRVGKSSVKITEAGIEIVSGTGKVINPGAYAAGTDKTTAQQTHLMNDTAYPLSGSLVVDSSGVILKGPYIANTATNSFKASTVLGSVFSLSDFNAKLYAPQTNIIGGAALDSTATSLLPTLLKGVPDIADTSLGRDAVYAGGLRDCGKTKAPNLTSFAGSALATAAKGISTALGAINIIGGGASSLLSITGSMLKLQPTSMSLSSQTIKEYFMHLYEICNPAAGFLAMADRSSRTAVLKKAPACFSVNSSNLAFELFIVDMARMIEAGLGRAKTSTSSTELAERQAEYNKKASTYAKKRKTRQTLEQSAATPEEIRKARADEASAETEMNEAAQALDSYIKSLQDTFTDPNAALPTPEYSSSTIAGLVLTTIAGGALYAVGQALLPKILNATGRWETLANLLYLSKREVLDGLQELTVISESETAMRNQAAALERSAQVVEDDETAADDSDAAMREQSLATTTTTTTATATHQEASLKIIVGTEDKTFARHQVVGATENAMSTIITHTGPVMNN